MDNVDKERKISKDNGNKRGTFDKERDVPKYNSSKRYIVEKDQSNKRNTVDKEHKIPKEDTVEKEHSNKRATVNKEYKNVKENCRKKDIVDKEHSHKRHTIDKECKVPNENRSKRDNVDKEHKIPKENNSMRDNIEQERKIPKESRSKRDNVDKDRKIPKENNNTNATVEKENENKRATVDKGYRIPKKNYSKRDNVDKERKIPKEISNATDTVQRENTNKRAVEKEYSNKSATVYKGYRIPKKNCNTSASVKKEIIKQISNKRAVEKEIPKENNNKRVTFDKVIPKDNSNERATVDNEISIENKRSAEKETKKNIKKRPFEKDKNKARKNLTAKFKDTKKKTNRDDKRKYTQKGEMFDMLIMDEDQLMKLRNEQRAAQSFRRFPHKCYSCIFGFIGEKQLLKHNTYAHSAKAGAFACEICDSRLGDPRKLAVHKKQHYVCIKCRKCDERFTMRNRQAAYRHYQLHEKNQKPVFRKRYNIFRVVKLNDRKMQRMRSELLTADWYLRSKFRCDQCVINFPSCAQREYHARTRHHESVGRYICAICTLRTPSKSLLEKHISAHYHCYECTECNTKFLRKDTADTHYRRAHRLGKIFFCDYCTDTFMKQRDAVAHRDAHTSFPCRLCGRVFTTHKQLNAHLNQLRNDKVHNGTASGTRCTTCDRLFTSEIKLQRHLMSHKPRACTLCDRTFATPKHLYAHCKQAHRKRKPSDPSNAYCVECDKQLGTYSSYRKHVALKHGPGPSVYPCSKCEKIFQADRALRSHYNLEHLHKTDFRCDICDKCFITSGSLKRHQQYIHAGVPKPRKHVCDLCDRAFTAKLVLENHRRTHTGERPFKCDKCKASFTQKVSLQIHIKKVHGFEPKESNEEPKESNEEPKKSNELIVPRYVVASARRSAARKQCEDKNVPSGDIVTTTREQDVLPIEVQVEPVERDISLLLC